MEIALFIIIALAALLIYAVRRASAHPDPEANPNTERARRDFPPRTFSVIFPLLCVREKRERPLVSDGHFRQREAIDNAIAEVAWSAKLDAIKPRRENQFAPMPAVLFHTVRVDKDGLRQNPLFVDEQTVQAAWQDNLHPCHPHSIGGPGPSPARRKPPCIATAPAAYYAVCFYAHGSGEYGMGGQSTGAHQNEQDCFTGAVSLLEQVAHENSWAGANVHEVNMSSGKTRDYVDKEYAPPPVVVLYKVEGTSEQVKADIIAPPAEVITRFRRAWFSNLPQGHPAA